MDSVDREVRRCGQMNLPLSGVKIYHGECSDTKITMGGLEGIFSIFACIAW
jgi:hypothetical protein